MGKLPNTLMRPALSNAKGFNESWSIVRLNELILKEMGLVWDSPEPAGKIIFSKSFQGKFYPKCKACLKDSFPDLENESFDLVLKDPRFCRTFPVWAKVLQDLEVKCKVIIPLRSPLDACLSLVKRDDISPEFAVLIWYWHLVEGLIHTQAMDVKFIFYEELLKNPRRHMDSMLGITLSKDAASFVDPKLDHSSRSQISKIISPELEPFNTAILLFEKLRSLSFPDDNLISELRGRYFFDLIVKDFAERKNASREKGMISEISRLNGLPKKEIRKRFLGPGKMSSSQSGNANDDMQTSQLDDRNGVSKTLQFMRNLIT